MISFQVWFDSSSGADQFEQGHERLDGGLEIPFPSARLLAQMARASLLCGRPAVFKKAGQGHAQRSALHSGEHIQSTEFDLFFPIRVKNRPQVIEKALKEFFRDRL